jgi:hypothetical protein
MPSIWNRDPSHGRRDPGKGTETIPSSTTLSGWLLAHPRSETKADSQRDFVQANILDPGPGYRQVAGLYCEDINLLVRLRTVLDMLSIALMV